MGICFHSSYINVNLDTKQNTETISKLQCSLTIKHLVIKTPHKQRLQMSYLHEENQFHIV